MTSIQQRLRGNFRVEMFKFGLYIMFPIGILFLFNEQDLIPEQIKSPWLKHQTDPTTLYKIPKDMDQISRVAEQMKKEYQANKTIE